jgi:O-antigen/teichoic acid export membrane protein
MAWSSIILLIMGGGVGEALIYRMHDESFGMGRSIGRLLGLSVVLGVVAGAVFLGVVSLQPHNSSTTLGALALAFISPVYMLHRWFISVLQGSNNLLAWNVARSAPAVLYVIVVVALWVNEMLTVSLAVLTYCLSLALGAGIALLSVRRTLGRGHHHETISVRLWLVGLFGFGARAHGAKLASQLSQNLDKGLLAFFLTPSQLGIYVVATTYSLLPGAFPESIAARAYGVMSGIREERPLRAAEEESLRTGIVLSTVLYGTTLLAAPVLIPFLFGTDFAQAVLPSVALSVAAWVFFCSRAAASALLARGAAGRLSAAEGGALFVQIALLLVFTPLFSLAGAVAASSVSYLLSAALVYLLWRHARAKLVRSDECG